MTWKATQLDLIPRERPEALLAYLESRLPKTELLPASAVATACNVSMTKVYAWIDDGSVQAFDAGTAGKPYWRIYRLSVLRLFERGMAGGVEDGDQRSEVAGRKGGRR